MTSKMRYGRINMSQKAKPRRRSCALPTKCCTRLSTRSKRAVQPPGHAASLIHRQSERSWRCSSCPPTVRSTASTRASECLAKVARYKTGSKHLLGTSVNRCVSSGFTLYLLSPRPLWASVSKYSPRERRGSRPAARSTSVSTRWQRLPSPLASRSHEPITSP